MYIYLEDAVLHQTEEIQPNSPGSQWMYGGRDESITEMFSPLGIYIWDGVAA